MSESNEKPDEKPNDKPNEPEKLALTQAELDALISSRVGAALAQAEKKRTAVPAETLKELDELRAERAERERQKLEAKGEYQKALDAQAAAIAAKFEPEIKARDEKIAKREERLRREVVTNQLMSAAAQGNAINVEQVVALLSHQVRLNDEFEPEVVDGNGNPRFVGDKPMTPSQLVDDFLRTNTHFVKANGKGGDSKGGLSKTGGNDPATPLAQKEAELAKAAEEIQRTGSPDAIAKHLRLTREVKALKSSAA